MVETRTTTFRFDDETLALLDAAAKRMGCSRAQAIRNLLVRSAKEDEARNEARKKQQAAMADRLIAKFGNDAALHIALNAEREPVAQIGKQPADNDLYIFGLAVEEEGEFFMDIYISDSTTSRLRLFVGRLPAFQNAHLSIPLADLRPSDR